MCWVCTVRSAVEDNNTATLRIMLGRLKELARMARQGKIAFVNQKLTDYDQVLNKKELKDHGGDVVAALNARIRWISARHISGPQAKAQHEDLDPDFIRFGMVESKKGNR